MFTSQMPFLLPNHSVKALKDVLHTNKYQINNIKLFNETNTEKRYLTNGLINTTTVACCLVPSEPS